MVKLFAHRGLAKTKDQQNTIASLKNAFEEKFEAIEFDIWFFEEKLVLKHDLPEKSEVKNLPILRDYLIYGNKLQYWLDFKNLDEENCFEALKLVKKEIDEAEINLENVYFAPFITNYYLVEKVFLVIKKIFGSQVNLVAVCEELKSAEDEDLLESFLTKNKVKFLSIFHKLINRNLSKKFNGISFFAWTVNDISRIKELQEIGVANFATDNITPEIYDQNT